MSIDSALTHRLRGVIKRLLHRAGLEVRPGRGSVGPGTSSRPIASAQLFCQDLAARGFQPAAILDVGANRGDWTRMLLEVYPSARYLLLEPLSEMASQLSSLVKSKDNVEWLGVAAGAQRGEQALTVWDDLNGSSFLPAAKDELISSGRQRLVKVMPIDDVIEEQRFPVPDLVKLDIQGFELEALKGGTRLIGRTEIFVLETSLFRFLDSTPLLSEVVAFMAERGYEVYDVVDYARRPHDGALAQVDLAFARSSGFLRTSNRWE